MSGPKSAGRPATNPLIRFWNVLRPDDPLFRRRGGRRHLTFTLDTRRGWHLSEDTHAELHSQQQRHGFALTVVVVDTDPRLVEEHGAWVPVVAVNDKVRYRGRVNPVLLARLLRGESGRD